MSIRKGKVIVVAYEVFHNLALTILSDLLPALFLGLLSCVFWLAPDCTRLLSITVSCQACAS